MAIISGHSGRRIFLAILAITGSAWGTPTTLDPRATTSSNAKWSFIECVADRLDMEFEGFTITPDVPPERLSYPPYEGLGPATEAHQSPVVFWPFAKKLSMLPVPVAITEPLALTNDPTFLQANDSETTGLGDGDESLHTFYQLHDPIRSTRRHSLAAQHCAGESPETRPSCITEYATPSDSCITDLRRGLFVGRHSKVSGYPIFPPIQLILVIVDDPVVLIRFEAYGGIQELRYRVTSHRPTTTRFPLSAPTSRAFSDAGCPASAVTRALPGCSTDWREAWPAGAFEAQRSAGL